MIGEHASEHELNDYVDGLLPVAEMEEFDSHILVCDRCSSELQQLRALLAGLGSLPKAISPGEDLRPRIRARIEQTQRGIARTVIPRPRTLWSVRYPLAAAAVLLLVISSTATFFIARGAQNHPMTTAPVPQRAREDATFAQFRVLEAEYVRAADELRDALEGEGETLDPVTAELLSRNLRVIDGAIQESRAALLANPASEVLQHMILATYERKLDILRRAESLGTTS